MRKIGFMDTSTLSAISNGFADVVAAAGPAVVQVHGRRRPVSGVVFAPDSVLTTTRALGREGHLRVVAPDGRALDAELAGWDPATGLAVLRVAGLQATPATRGDARPRVGQLAIALARSWSNALTASAGIVSVIGGPLRTGRGQSIEEVIRTTAPMHDGFAGGAFVDTSGGVIGICTAADIRGLGVVIPASIAWRTAADVLEHGRPGRAFLGVAGQQVRLPDGQAAAAGRDHGLLVAGVSAGSPAERAGLLVGDVIVGFGEHPIASAEQLLQVLRGVAPGSAAQIAVLRGGTRTEVPVTMDNKK
jgi:S1-C subfamily serine protease